MSLDSDTTCFGHRVQVLHANCPSVSYQLTAGAVRLGILGSGGSWLGDPVPFVLLVAALSWRLRLVGEGHDGSGGIRSGGGVLAVGEAMQVLTGCVDGAVDRTLSRAPHAVLLRLIQVV